jgi:hypothetical protein
MVVEQPSVRRFGEASRLATGGGSKSRLETRALDELSPVRPMWADAGAFLEAHRYVGYLVTKRLGEAPPTLDSQDRVELNQTE